MATYTVHEPPVETAGVAPEPDRFIFVRDGFSFWAFLLAPFWMIRHRLWLVLAGYLVITLVLQIALQLIGAPTGVIVSIAALLALLVGFEAATLRRFTLTRRRWNNVGIVVGDDLESAERRFFDAFIQGEPARWSPRQSVMPSWSRPQHASEIVGLFPQAGLPR